MWHPGKLLLLLFAAAHEQLTPYVPCAPLLGQSALPRILCSAVPTYDEQSQKSGRCLIYFDTPEGQHVGVAEIEGRIIRVVSDASGTRQKLWLRL
jgi:hypothetical protein